MTPVDIMNSLIRLETKLDGLTTSANSASGTDSTPPSLRLRPFSHFEDWQTRISQKYTSAPQDIHDCLTVPHRVILWPHIRIYLVNSGLLDESELNHIKDMGTPLFIRLELERQTNLLPCTPGLPSIQFGDLISDHSQTTRRVFPAITMQHAREYTEAYFHNFNTLYPILDYASFSEDLVKRALGEGYIDGDPQIVLALMVFALGQVAIDGIRGQPISTHNGVPSGFRGGTLTNPPGIHIFNEARRRMGFVATMCTLENAQIMLLQATYYEANSKHVDFWRSTVAASTACQILVKCHDADISSPNGDMLVRTYWACVLNEDLFHLDLGLPRTGIHLLQDEVPLPTFCKTEVSSQPGAEEPPYYQYHFLALITLRRLIIRVNKVIHGCTSSYHHRSDRYQLTVSQHLQFQRSPLIITVAHLLQ
jgi:hypothetical protein